MSISYSHMGLYHDEMRTASSITPPCQNFFEESTVNGRNPSIRSHFTPSCSPPHSYSSSINHRNKAHFSDDSKDDSNRSFEHGARGGLPRNNTLPAGAVDPATGEISFTFDQVLAGGFFDTFVKDKAGCHFLQENFPGERTTLRYRLYGELESKEGFFEEMCKDVFANFFVQKMIERSTREEQRLIAIWIGNSMFALCMNRYSCRVIQKAIEYLPDEMKVPLLNELQTGDLVMLTVDQNANHVIQKIFHSFHIKYWSFIIFALVENSFFSVVENKYGCRVMQLAIELLSDPKYDEFLFETHEVEMRWQLLDMVMKKLVDNCERLSSNEFANYVIQHVITAASLAKYRDIIVERCLLGNLLSMSQEKYASHVIEKALEHSSPLMVREMMDELFDGYVPHPDTKKDALDILLFHQYGNYVLQRMLVISSSKKEYRLDTRTRGNWLARLEDKIVKNTGKLSRYSSGKKILDMVRSVRGLPPINHGVHHSSPRLKQINPGVGQSSRKNHNSTIPHCYPLPNPCLTCVRVPDLYL